MEVKNEDLLMNGLAAGGATRMWKEIMIDALPVMKSLVSRGAKVLEIGYGDGNLSCFLVKELGWKMVGIDPDRIAYKTASHIAAILGLCDNAEFACIKSQDYLKMANEFDAIFIKTVLYNARTIQEYDIWLKSIYRALKPGGILINFETGRSNSLVQLYRYILHREYRNWCLYSSDIEIIYNNLFEIIYKRYYGGISQFFSFQSIPFRVARLAESKILQRNANNCFAVAIIGRKKNQLRFYNNQAENKDMLCG